MSFLQGSFDLFTGQRTSHMGSYQYVDHAGAKRDGESMSGAKLWAAIEAAQTSSTNPNLFSAEETLIQKAAEEIGRYIPDGTSVLELGPGTKRAFSRKTMPILKTLGSQTYICVDESRAFLQGLSANDLLPGVGVEAIEDDFFEGDHCYHDDEENNALVCMFGSTISNILAPLNDELPKNALTDHLTRLAETTSKGWLLISFDADQNGEHIRAFYRQQEKFQLNTFYRMQAELPLTPTFDPEAFAYEPEWRPRSSQLAHMAVVTRDMSFTLADKPIQLHKGQKFHLKNSYKFPLAFFEMCCEEAGLEPVKIWQNTSPTKVYLLKKQDAVAYQAVQQPLPLLRAK